MTSLMRRVFFAAILCAGTMGAAGQVVAVQPPNPSDAHVITADVVVWHTGYRFHSAQVNGSVVTLLFETRIPSVAPIVFLERVTIGRLPAGTYTLNARYVDYGEDQVTIILDRTEGPFTLVVSAAHFVPALDWIGLAALAVAMAAVAAFILRR